MSIDTVPAAQAVEALIADYGKLVFRVIFGLTGDWQESQDLTQETFLTAFKAIEAARRASGANFHAKAWLMPFLLVNTYILHFEQSICTIFSLFKTAKKETRLE